MNYIINNQQIGLGRQITCHLDKYLFRKAAWQWLNPVHIRLLPVGAEFVGQCQKLVDQFAELPLRIEVDDRSISVSSKLKAAHQDYVPYKIVIGQKEVSNDFSELRELVKKIALEVEEKPCVPLEWPVEVSRQL